MQIPFTVRYKIILDGLIYRKNRIPFASPCPKIKTLEKEQILHCNPSPKIRSKR